MKNKVWTTVGVAALGYFVDIYDIQVFRIIGVESLRDGLKIPQEQISYYFNDVLFNFQMAGMLIGGILWGIMGDKLGRKSVLFGSILLYSLANIFNAFATNIPIYCMWRFLAGLGLAGEIGAAITLTSEVMSKENRGYGTMLIVVTGAFGAIVAFLISKKLGWLAEMLHLQSWQLVYIIGGVLGLLLLLLRFSTFESGMFEQVKKSDVEKGNFLSLFTNSERFKRYVYCIFLGLPIWYAVGVLIGRSAEIAKINGVNGTIEVAASTMWCYLGLAVGDLASAWLSQVLKSRKKAVIYFMYATAAFFLVFWYAKGMSVNQFYFMTFMIGALTGYWALFVTIAAEQFGTNIRATVATTVPNFVRGAVIPITLSVSVLSRSIGVINAAVVVGSICFVLGFIAILGLKDTFGKDLDYIEP